MAVKELRGLMKEKADGGDDLAKAVQDSFGEKPDSLLVRFIRARKYDVPRAFDLMKGASCRQASAAPARPPAFAHSPHFLLQATCASGRITRSSLRT